MLIAVIVLAVAVLLLGGGMLFLLKINQTQGETLGRLTTYSNHTNDVILEKLEVIKQQEADKADLESKLEKTAWELNAAHGLLERVVVLIPDDVSSISVKTEKEEDAVVEEAKVEEKEEVASTSTEKDNTE